MEMEKRRHKHVCKPRLRVIIKFKQVSLSLDLKEGRQKNRETNRGGGSEGT